MPTDYIPPHHRQEKRSQLALLLAGFLVMAGALLILFGIFAYSIYNFYANPKVSTVDAACKSFLEAEARTISAHHETFAECLEKVKTTSPIKLRCIEGCGYGRSHTHDELIQCRDDGWIITDGLREPRSGP